jgi:hypothetical protein
MELGRNRRSSRSRRSLGVGLIVTAIAALFVTRLAADEAATAGIFVEDPQTQAETKLEATMTMDYQAEGIAKSVFTGGLAKPKLIWTYGGGRADQRLPAQPLFRFRFDAKASRNAQDPAAMMAMMMGGGPALPAGAKTPTDFLLLALEVDADTRRVVTKTARNGAANPQNATVELAVEKVAADDFRVRVKQPLAAGEYGFYYRGPDGQGRIWAFGVD